MGGVGDGPLDIFSRRIYAIVYRNPYPGGRDRYTKAEMMVGK
jgi:hypothetical protein